MSDYVSPTDLSAPISDNLNPSNQYSTSQTDYDPHADSFPYVSHTTSSPCSLISYIDTYIVPIDV